MPVVRFVGRVGHLVKMKKRNVRGVVNIPPVGEQPQSQALFFAMKVKPRVIRNFVNQVPVRKQKTARYVAAQNMLPYKHMLRPESQSRILVRQA
jgi:hypothetical protein